MNALGTRFGFTSIRSEERKNTSQAKKKNHDMTRQIGKKHTHAASTNFSMWLRGEKGTGGNNRATKQKWARTVSRKSNSPMRNEMSGTSVGIWAHAQVRGNEGGENHTAATNNKSPTTRSRMKMRAGGITSSERETPKIKNLCHRFGTSRQHIKMPKAKEL